MAAEIERLKLKLKNYLLSMRPWSFTASFVSIVLGSVLAWKSDNSFDFRLFFLTLTTIFSTHAAGNLVNTLYDFKNGIDTKTSDDKTIVKGILKLKEVESLIYICYEVAMASFIVICLGFPHVTIKYCLPLFMAGILASFLYTGSIGLKYIAMGDVVVLIAFGPIITLFTYSVQTGQISVLCIICAIPLAILTEAILHSNNIRDLETDKKADIVTIAILLGRSKASMLYIGLVFIPYISTTAMAILLSYWLFLPLLSLPLAVNLVKECWYGNGNNHLDDRTHHQSNLSSIPQDTAMLNLVFGVLYIIGLWM